MKAPRSRQGYVLVMVLIITAVGLLFGAGSLLLFRYQCQLRIDRQHELEKVYAVRSALNYIRTYSGEVDENNLSFRYYTGSDRNLGIHVKPVAQIFPDAKKRHLFTKGGNQFSVNNSDKVACECNRYDAHYESVYDYEYGAIGVTNLLLSNYNSGRACFGLVCDDQVTTSNATWWVNIGMRSTGGWLQEDYGRRYFFQPLEYAYYDRTNDIMRLCLIRNVTNLSARAGCNHGWPLSQAGERALVFEISPKNLQEATDGDNNNAEMSLYEYHFTDGGLLEKTLLMPVWENRPSLCYMGLQVAGDKVSMFYVDNGGVTGDGQDDTAYLSRGYTFSDTAQLSTNLYYYFRDRRTIGGREYGGLYTNLVTGKVEAPEMRAVFEVERRQCLSVMNTSRSSLTDFIVTPAYQYDVFLEHPANVTNRATVAQKIGEYDRSGPSYTVLTYDTHGTEHKGFRYDERHPNGE